MPSIKRIIATGILTFSLATGAALAGAGSAFAIDSVSCGSRTDFLTLIASDGVKTCYANSGTIYPSGISWPRFNKISSGNNVVTVKYYTSAGLTTIGLNKWESVTFPQGGYLVGVVTIH